MGKTTPPAVTSRDDFLNRVEAALHAGTVPVALALSDLDGFAVINRTLGRDAGDKVLVAWEKLLSRNVSDATVARLGGDEFAVLIPGASAEEALIVLDEVRRHFSDTGVKGVEAKVSASIGIAANPPHGATPSQLFEAAGAALMRAKRDGDGRVAIYVEEKMTLKTNYYSRASLDRLAKLAASTERTEASLLREALDDLLDKHREQF